MLRLKKKNNPTKQQQNQSPKTVTNQSIPDSSCLEKPPSHSHIFYNAQHLTFEQNTDTIQITYLAAQVAAKLLDDWWRGINSNTSTYVRHTGTWEQKHTQKKSICISIKQIYCFKRNSNKIICSIQCILHCWGNLRVS